MATDGAYTSQKSEDEGSKTKGSHARRERKAERAEKAEENE